MKSILRASVLVSALSLAQTGWPAPLPADVRDAVQQIRTGDGVQPRPPHYLLEQTVPKAAGDPQQRRELTTLLAGAAAAPDTTPPARTLLCQHLAKLGAAAEAPTLRKLLAEPASAADARIALGEHEVRPTPPEAEAACLAQAASQKAATRVAGLAALAAYYPKAAAPACVDALRDPDPTVAATALQRLGALDGAALARALPALAPDRQALALTVVAENRITAARDAAARLARCEHEDVRAAALRALGAVGDASSVTLLAELEASDALALLQAEGADAAIVQALARPAAAPARLALLNAAAARGLSELTPVLLRAAADADPAVRAAALKLLGRHGETAAYPQLVALLGGPDGEAAEEAVRLLGRRMTDRPARLAPLVARAREGQAAARAAALRVLPPLGGEDALAPVRDGLACADPAVRDAAVRALAAWPDPAAVPELRRLADAPAASTVHKTLAARALDRLSSQGTRHAALAYLDCGPQMQVSGKEGVTLRVAAGKAWTFAEQPAATVAFDGAEVVIEAAGLKPDRAYQLGFTWWDYDANGRAQSVWVGGRQALARTALPAWKGRQEQAAALTVEVPAAEVKDGKVRLRFRREAASNAVVGEVWLSDAATAGAAISVAPAPAAQEAPRPLGQPEVRANAGAPKKVLILTGMEHHNNWRQLTPLLVGALQQDPRLEVSVSEEPRLMTQAETLSRYQCFVLLYNNSDKQPAPEGALTNLKAAVEGGRGLVLVHFASGAFFDWTKKQVDPAFGTIAGRVWNPQLRGHDPHGTFTVRIADPHHPITRGLQDFQTLDELYTCLEGDAPIQVLADAVSKVDQKTYPLVFTLTPGKGRTFHCALGHDPRAFGEPVLNLYRRGTLWAAGLDNQ